MKIRFLVEMKVEETIEITQEEFEDLESMNDEEKQDFFWDKAIHYKSETTNIEIKKV